MSNFEFTRLHPLYRVYVKFRIGDYPDIRRQHLKRLLHAINYGAYDMTRVEKLIAYIKKRRLREQS